jgi:sugar lactone lactonase YvrE
MRIDTPAVTRLTDIPLGCGEGPTWSAQENALWFVDIQAPALFRLDAATGTIARFAMPSSIGSFGLATGGRLVVALRDGVYWFDPRTNALTLLCRPEPDRPQNRMNDGKVGPDGRFWVGSMDDRPEKEPIASLYRIDTTGRCDRMVGDLIVSNGLAWSPDGRTMFHSDVRDGGIANKRRLRMMEDAEGRPDGAACDAEGFYWSAGVSAGVLNRIAPDGRIDRKVVLPVAAPTMPCFGGPDLRTLYVTSLTSDRLGPKEAGTLIRFEVDVPGAPVARFGEPLAG